MNVMTASAPLRLRPMVLPGESPGAHLMRLFEINGWPWSRERFRSRGLNISQVFYGSNDAVFQAFEMDLAPFAMTAARVHSYKLVTVAGEQLHRDDWSTLVRQWCPKCFQDDLHDESLGGRSPGWRVHRRFWWDAMSVTTCPIHAVRLERLCPVCGDPIKWDTGSLTTCRNHHSLLGCKPVKVAQKDIVGDAYIVGRLGGGPRMTVPFLDALPLRDAIDAMEHFGVAAAGGAFSAMSKFKDDRHPEIRSVGLRIAAGWPGAFNDVLDRLASRPDVGLGAWGQDQVYGYLVMWARGNRKTPLGKAVNDAILAHFAQRSVVRGGSAAERFVDEGGPVCLAQIAKAVGLGSMATRKHLVRIGVWPKDTKRGTPVLFPPGIVAELKGVLDDLANAKKLRELHGVGRTQSRRIAAADLTPQIGPPKMRNRKSFSRAAVVAWVTGLAGDAPEVQTAPLGLRDIPTASRWAGVGGIVGIVTLIEKGDVKVRARLVGGKGLYALLVDPAEVERAGRIQVGGEFSPKEAANLLSMHPDSVSACICDGLLDFTRQGAQRVAISQVAIDKFRATYVTTSEIARALDTKPRYAAVVLRENGVEPIATREIASRMRVAIYRRSDIPADLGERYRRRYPKA